MKLYEKSSAELSEMLRRRECSAAEILNDVRSRISCIEGKIGAYITLNDNAEEAAKAVDRAIAQGEELHPLAGIPIALKDNISTRGIRTTCASKMLEGYIPPYDAAVTEKLKSAGAVITGKTNMDEFAMGWSTETSYFGRTCNPHNTAYVPGGSSGGSAAAVSSGEAILALGSDTGGSVRQPAALCGIVGMKPTYGVISRYGLIAYASSLDQIGVMGRTVEDAAMLLSAVSGHDRRDAASLIAPTEDYHNALKYKISGLRISVPEEYFTDIISDEVREAVYNALRLMEKCGAEIKRISLPSTKFAVNAYYIIACAEASSNLARYDGVKYGFRAENYTSLSDMYAKTRSEGFGDEVKRRIMLGTYVLSAGFRDKYYKRAVAARRLICREFDDAFKECDIIAAPSFPTPAFRFGEAGDDAVRRYSSDICTVPASIAGLPAISIPCGRSRNGLPIGLQFIGDRLSEQLLLDAANVYEKNSGGFNCIAKLEEGTDE